MILFVRFQAIIIIILYAHTVLFKLVCLLLVCLLIKSKSVSDPTELQKSLRGLSLTSINHHKNIFMHICRFD